MTTSVLVKLGSWSDMADLFAWEIGSGIKLTDWINHFFNQTLQRDGFVGAWADVYSDKNQQLGVKLAAPFGNVAGYAKSVPAFIKAAKVGHQIYQANRAGIIGRQLFYYLPVGMALTNFRSIQLLHYPPYSARTFMDYLYSPTNRRCESLLVYNGWDPAKVTLNERVVDAVPLAGPGSDATGIDEFEDDFIPYSKGMLQALLDTSLKRTQPVVAYGGPAHQWLQKAFPKQAPKKLDVLSLFKVRVGKGKAVTPILCANHPSEFLFYSKQTKQWAFTIVQQDLIAFRWQVRMSQRWDADPAKVLKDAKAYWERRPAAVRKIVAAQIEEFGFPKV